jgi:hypothetical protein
VDRLRKTFRWALATLCAIAAFVVGATAIASAASRTPAGRDHRFAASYAGIGHGATTGTAASGNAKLRGRGRLIGRGSLRGSGQGTFTSQTCVTFSGRAVLSGNKGSLRIVARRGQACASGGGNTVSFVGRATVTGGTATFADARGRLSFSGSFNRSSGRVTISLSGLIRYRA